MPTNILLFGSALGKQMLAKVIHDKYASMDIESRIIDWSSSTAYDLFTNLNVGFFEGIIINITDDVTPPCLADHPEDIYQIITVNKGLCFGFDTDLPF